MRKRKTSLQPNLKAARAVVLGQDGVGKSGQVLFSFNGVRLLITKIVPCTMKFYHVASILIAIILSANKANFRPLYFHLLLYKARGTRKFKCLSSFVRLTQTTNKDVKFRRNCVQAERIMLNCCCKLKQNFKAI